MAPLDTDEERSYREAWSEIARAMEDGTSWSGHERNVAWLNLGGGEFVDASAVLGLDHVEDGRVVLRTDFDGDGDLDLWLRSRNGPTLRYLENTSNPAWSLHVESARPCEVVAVRDDDARSSWTSRPTSDGYLAGPTDRVVASLDAVPSSVRIRIGEAWRELSSDELSAHATVRLDAQGEVDFIPRRTVAVGGAGALEAGALPTRVVLRTPLVLPPERLSTLAEGTGARLAVVHSVECPTCERVLPRLALGLEPDPPVQTTFHATDVDDVSNGSDETAFVHAVAATTLGPGAELGLPLGLLIDAEGRVQAVYTGDLDADELRRDVRAFVTNPVQGARRSTWGHPGARGRWFHGAPRAYGDLTRSLQRAGLDSDASFYASQRR